MKSVPLGELIRAIGGRAGRDVNLPVYSVTKHAGFVPSLEFFKKQVFSRDLDDYKLVEAGAFAYATIHLDEGSIGIAPERCLISPMYTVFGVDESRVYPAYLIRFLKSPLALAHYPQLGKGAVHRRKAISLASLGGLELPLPAIDEQRRIAAILDQADALRVKRRQVVAHLDSLTQSIFQDMFGDEPSSATVDEVATFIRTGPFGSQLLHSEFVNEGVAVLGLDNVVSNEFKWVERRYIARSKYEQLKRYRVNAGDVLISIMGTTGRCVVVPDDIPTAINTKHICAITVNRACIIPAFLRAAFLWHQGSREHLHRQTKGSIMDGLNMGIIRAMPVPLPFVERQLEFADQSEAVNRHRSRVIESLGAQNELLATLQSRAFRGEL